MLELTWIVKIIGWAIFSFVVGVIAYFSGLDFETASHKLREHLEYLTCGGMGFGSLFISHNYLILDVNVIIVRETVIFGNLIATILITFFFTRWLKSKWPEKAKDADSEDTDN